MAGNEQPDKEPAAPVAAGAEPSAKGRQSFSAVRRTLSEDELSSPAVQRMLLDELERLDRECEALKSFRDRFHQASERCAVHDEQKKGQVAMEVVHGVCLAIGGVLIGWAPSAWDKQPTGWLCLLCGAVLFVCGVVVKVIRK